MYLSNLVSTSSVKGAVGLTIRCARGRMRALGASLIWLQDSAAAYCSNN